MTLATTSPALRLLLACADRSRGSARHAAILEAASALGDDWTAFIDLAERHRMHSLAHDGLVEAGITPPPKLADVARRARMAGLRLTGEASRQLGRLRDAGIDAIVIKGPVLSSYLYGDPCLRDCKDLDLLVSSDDLRTAASILTQDGYRLKGPEPPWDEPTIEYWRRGAKDIAFVHRARRIQIELHYRLKSARQLLPELGPQAARQTVDLASTAFRIFDRGDLFAYLCAHDATNLWHRVKWLADLRAMIALSDPSEVLALFQHAQRLQVGRCAAVALLLCQRLWGQQLPEPVLRLRDDDKRVARLEKLALKVLAGPFPPASQFMQTSMSIAAFGLADGWAYRRSVLENVIYRGDLIAEFPLPRQLAWLYAPVRFWVWIRSSLTGGLTPRLRGTVRANAPD